MTVKVVTIGGGGGHSAVVEALKDLPISLTCLCNTVDDGGGSGRLVREYGVHSPGDFRRILATLAQANGEVLNYRFTSGQLEGQTVSNILLAGLELSSGSIQQAIDTIRQWMGITPVIAPITENVPVLNAKTKSGEEITGQASIVKYVRTQNDPIETLWLEPKNSSLSVVAKQSLQEADYVIVTMGDLYSSIAPSFCIEELQQVWGTFKTKVIWLPNVAVTPGHVHYEKISGALQFFQSLSKDFVPDYIIAHEGELSKDLLQQLQERKYGVSKMDIESSDKTTVIKEYLVDRMAVPQKQAGDMIDRSPVKYNINVLKNIFQKVLLS